jgi:hypothetical protein
MGTTKYSVESPPLKKKKKEEVATAVTELQPGAELGLFIRRG